MTKTWEATKNVQQVRNEDGKEMLQQMRNEDGKECLQNMLGKIVVAKVYNVN